MVEEIDGAADRGVHRGADLADHTDHADDRAADRSAAKARRNMSVATALALLCLTALTHWPKLGIGTIEDPGPDKTIHMVAFALMAGGVWMSGWIRSLPILWIAGALWCAADELTQALPGLGRRAEWEDWVADLLGLTIAVAWILATRPIGGWQSLRRRALRDHSIAEVFQHAWAWLVPPLAAGLGALAAWPVFAFIGARSWAMPSLQVTVTGMLVLALASAFASVEVLVRLLRPSPWPALADRAHAKLVVGPVLAGLALLVALTALAQVALLLRTRFASMALAEDWYRRLPQTFRAALDLALIMLIAAWACLRARRRVAARIDRAHRECLRCDHDLRGIAPSGGVGRCPECGAPYEVPPEGTAPLAGAAPIGGAPFDAAAP